LARGKLILFSKKSRNQEPKAPRTEGPGNSRIQELKNMEKKQGFWLIKRKKWGCGMWMKKI
jgi:hypothetical protein